MTTKGMLAANACYAEVGDVCRYKLNDMRLRDARFRQSITCHVVLGTYRQADEALKWH